MKGNPEKIFYKGLVFGFLGALGFSLKAIISKLMYKVGISDALTVLTLRMMFVFPFYFSVEFYQILKSKKRVLPLKVILRISFIAAFGYYLASLLDFWALEYVTASFERIVLYTYPSFVLLLGYFFFKKKVYKKQIVSLVVISLGVIIAYYSDIEFTGLRNTTIGFLLLIMCTFSFSIYVLLSENQIYKIGVIRYTNHVMMVASFFVFFHYFIKHEEFYSLFEFSSEIYYYSIVLAVFCTFLPSYFATSALQILGSNNFALVGGFGPLVTIFFAIFLLDEQLTLTYVIGGTLVIFGILYLKIKK